MTVDRRYAWPLGLSVVLAVVCGVALGWDEARSLWGAGTAPPASTSPAETAPVAFSDVTEEAGLGAFRHETGAVGNKWFPETMGAGGGFLDYNGDGHLDILLVGGGTWEGEPVPPDHRALWLYRNDGNGTFTLRTEEAISAPSPLYVKIARTYQKLGIADSARTAYEQALAADSTNANAHLMCGQFLEDQGELEAALAQFRKALRLDPENANHRFAVGSQLYRTGQLEKAAKHLGRAADKRLLHSAAQGHLDRRCGGDG